MIVAWHEVPRPFGAQTSSSLHLSATLVHQVNDWGSGAAANFDWMREAKRENTRCGL